MRDRYNQTLYPGDKVTYRKPNRHSNGYDEIDYTVLGPSKRNEMVIVIDKPGGTHVTEDGKKGWGTSSGVIALVEGSRVYRCSGCDTRFIAQKADYLCPSCRE